MSAPPLPAALRGIPGLTYRKLDHWVRTGLLDLSDPLPGSGYRRHWPPLEIQVARDIAALTAAGLTLQAAARIARTARIGLAPDECQPVTVALTRTVAVTYTPH